MYAHKERQPTHYNLGAGQKYRGLIWEDKKARICLLKTKLSML